MSEEISEIEQRLAELTQLLQEKEAIVNAPLEAERLRKQIHELEAVKREMEQERAARIKKKIEELKERIKKIEREVNNILSLGRSLTKSINTYLTLVKEYHSIRAGLRKEGVENLPEAKILRAETIIKERKSAFSFNIIPVLSEAGGRETLERIAADLSKLTTKREVVACCIICGRAFRQSTLKKVEEEVDKHFKEDHKIPPPPSSYRLYGEW
ncbi:MAG: hypothetical protein QXT26_04075 [Thermoproteota archaeon]